MVTIHWAWIPSTFLSIRAYFTGSLQQFCDAGIGTLSLQRWGRCGPVKWRSLPNITKMAKGGVSVPPPGVWLHGPGSSLLLHTGYVERRMGTGSLDSRGHARQEKSYWRRSVTCRSALTMVAVDYHLKGKPESQSHSLRTHDSRNSV